MPTENGAAPLTLTDLEATERGIVRILTDLHELTDPLRSGQGFGSGGIPLMPHAKGCPVIRCNCQMRSVTEVERLLALMRNQAKQQAVDGISVGRLRWHVIAWYVDARRVTTFEQIPRKKGQKTLVPAGQDILRDTSGATLPVRPVERWTRHRDARKDRADLGVRWMAQRWALELEPMLPVEKAA